MAQETKTIQVYLGKRNKSFKILIEKILKKSNLKDKYIKLLISENSMKAYANAFTSKEVDPSNNYEVYEQLGDVTGGKFIVWYMYRRFPQLRCAKGVKVVARLKINYGAKKSFYKIAENLGFWPFISATEEERTRRLKPLLEDVFEAFLGVTEELIDEQIKQGVGYVIVYDILKSIFDDMKISLKYNDLFDAKTRLKELFDKFGSVRSILAEATLPEELGYLHYEEDIKRRADNIKYVVVYRIVGGTIERRGKQKNIRGGKYIKLGEGSAAKMTDAEQKASDRALVYLQNQGYYKAPPTEYALFEEGTYVC